MSATVSWSDVELLTRSRPNPAVAAGPGKRFAHNRGTWVGEPIEVVGIAQHPRSVSMRVRWRTLANGPASQAAATTAWPRLMPPSLHGT